MRTLKYERALELLVNEAEQFGVDLAVQDPVKFLMRNMVVGRGRALVLLKELEVRDLISLVYQGIGGAVVRVNIKKKEVPERFHEVDQEKRLIDSLWQMRHQSQKTPNLNIVHCLSFNDVFGLADIQKTMFYKLLGEFEKRGWIQYFKSSPSKILYITITEKFPIP